MDAAEAELKRLANSQAPIWGNGIRVGALCHGRFNENWLFSEDCWMIQEPGEASGAEEFLSTSMTSMRLLPHFARHCSRRANATYV
eukprot:SAG11_NODE_996_length_6253_cov_3.652909_3_plen_86_part_00